MSPAVCKIPVECCYWAVIEADASRKPAALRYRFEDVLPLPVDGLQVASVRLADGRTLMVGVEREALSARVAAAQGSPWRAIPERLPDHLREAGIEEGVLAACNLLTGPCEPVGRRRVRAVALGAVLLACWCGAAVWVFGGLAAARNYHNEAEAVAQRAHSLAAAVAPQDPDAAPQAPATRLIQELRRARQAAESAGPQSDLVPVLEALWRRWPEDMRVQLLSLDLDADRLVVHARAPDVEQAAAFASSLDHLRIGEVSWPAEPLDIPRVEADAAPFELSFVRPGEAGADR